MPRRYTVESLPQEQILFLLDLIVNGKTDRYVCAEFKAQFGKDLPKSSLNRWRNAAGNELADRAMVARLQAEQLLKDLKKEPDADKFKIVMESIEDRLLTAQSEVNKQDPFKLIVIQQEEKRRKIKEKELELKERALQFQEDQAKKSEQLQQDRLNIALDVWKFVLAYLLKNDPAGADVLTKHNDEIVSGLEAHLEASA